MSFLLLLGADRPMPCVERTGFSVRALDGHALFGEYGVSVCRRPGEPDADAFLVHKSFCYPIDLEVGTDACREVIRYLNENLAPGGQAELWLVWLGARDGPGRKNPLRMRHVSGHTVDEALEGLDAYAMLHPAPLRAAVRLDALGPGQFELLHGDRDVCLTVLN